MAGSPHTTRLPAVQDMTFEHVRGLRYAELFAVGPEQITVYNSIELSEAPPELWDALDAAAAARQLGVGLVLKNGPHWWMSDKLTVRFGVDVTTVGGIGFRVVARLPAFIAKAGRLEPPFYTVVEADKQGVNVYSAGALVYELASPEGEVFVMQSSSTPPEDLATLGGRLNPAAGWRFRTRTLGEELAVRMDGKVKTAMDDLRNVYNLPPGARAS